MKKSLKNKLGLMFFVFITVPLIILGSFSYIRTSSLLQNTVKNQLESTSNQTVQSIDEKIDSVDKYIKILSSDERMAKIASGDTTYNNEVYNYLQKIQKENSSIIERLVITNTSAKGIISDSSENYNADYSDRDYVKDALEGSKNTNKKTVLISKITGKPVIGIAYPLKIDNKIVGTLIGIIPFKGVSNVKLGNFGYAYMINKDGLIISHPKTDKVFKENILNSTNNQLKSLINEAKSSGTSEGYYSYNGSRKFGKFVSNNNWIIAVEADYGTYMSPASSIRNFTIIIAILALLITIFLAYRFSIRDIINPIKELESLMTKAGDGNLTVRSKINTKDELQTLGEYFNKMIEHQDNTIHNVRDASENLAASSEELASSNEEISSTTEQMTGTIEKVAQDAETQNNSIVEVSEVLVQLSSLVQISQNRALTAKKNSKHTMDTAEEGRNKIENTVDAIENIRKSSTATETTLKVLQELSKKVSGIIDTINSISSQTNLLALNAAIEAARAGEHGKGFTVVAEEVRKLSEETNTGANEISSLVSEMVNEITKAVKNMNSSKDAVESGVVIAKDADKSFVSIIDAVNQISSNVNEIVDVTKDEVATSDKIVNLINTVATITENTAASSEEVAASAEEQNSAIENVAASAEESSALAVSLNNLVEKFTI
ncbi:methyl-accepting chemotaxis protein McpA [Clostridium ragsdalei P11]|uniref:Methyl-accepting chemotaxis protein McpA n=1 Tax=Clostridium ragsdalei P11 TaxID=1353534 RepID=A0A1A6AP82_9CLOT|nr:methyl-accepting chemotaxis protein [Clostridium ragsdalei]OBR91862.1 methyl-accepting chemotaxis protein McpA [Clostridium ragsdalei P11]